MLNKHIKSFLLILIVISLIHSQPTPSGVNPFCQNDVPSQLTVQSTTLPVYDVVGSYYDNFTDSTADLYVTYGDKQDQTDYRFTAFENDEIEDTIVVQCANTYQFTFISLIEDVLILSNQTNTDVKYYGCRFDPKAKTPIQYVEIVVPAEVSPATKFQPHYFSNAVNQETLYIAISSANQGGIYSISWPAAPVAANTQVTPMLWGTLFNSPVPDLFGTGTFYYDPVQNQFTYNDGTTTVNNPNPTQFSPIILPLAENYLGLVFLNVAKTEGDIYFLNPYTYGTTSQPDESIEKISSNLPRLMTASDKISSFIVSGGTFFYWLNLDPQVQPRSYMITDHGVDLTNLKTVSLSSNKMTLLFEDSISYYRIVGNGLKTGQDPTTDVQLLFTKHFSKTKIEGDGEFTFKLSCVCGDLTRLTCFSSTLNCLVVKKAILECSKKDLPVDPSQLP